MAKGKSHRPSAIVVKGEKAEIELRRDGGVAVVDAADVHLVEGLSWRLHRSSSGGRYVSSKILGEDGRRHTVYLHRRIMGGQSPVDHRDGDGLNNTRSNLRECTSAENSSNRGPAKGRRFKGVFPASGSAKWVSKIRSRGVLHRSGRFDTQEEAAAWYDQMAKLLHGEFARPNA